MNDFLTFVCIQETVKVYIHKLELQKKKYRKEKENNNINSLGFKSVVKANG